MSQQGLLRDNLARRCDGCPIVGIDLTEFVDIASYHRIPHILPQLPDSDDMDESPADPLALNHCRCFRMLPLTQPTNTGSKHNITNH